MLHVTNGDSAVARLRAAGAQGDVLPWRDALHEGPVRAGLDHAQLRAERARFVAQRGWATEAGALAAMTARDERLARALVSGEDIVLWFESDLYDVLQLAQILDRVPAGRARLVLVGVDEFVGVAQLGVDELGRRSRGDELTERTVGAARELWSAFCARDPRGLEAIASGTVFADAARRHLQQFPWRGSGLSRTERALLEAALDGARPPADAFLAHQRQEERPFLGDAIAFEYLAALPRGEEARAILAGEREWEGRPERWLGGVRLPARTVTWRYDPATGRLAYDGS